MNDLSPQRSNTLDVPSLDGIRGLAVLLVLVGHAWNELGAKIPLDGGPIRNVLVSSYAGVDMLFIVSGFVLFLPVVLRGSLGPARDYAVRRAARIVPAFYLALVFSFVVATIIGVRTGGVGMLLSHLGFVHAEAHVTRQLGFGVNGAMWTMAAEVMFYAALPLVAGWYRRRPFLGLFLAVAGAEAWHLLTVKLPAVLDALGWSWAATSDAQIRMSLAFPSYLGHFAMGMTGAWLFVRLRDTDHVAFLKRNALAVMGVSAFGGLALLILRGAEDVARTAGPLDHWIRTTDRAFFFGVFVVATALAPRIARWPFENRVVRTLGVCCYGIYLVHLPLIKLLVHVLPFDVGTTDNTQLLVLVAIVVPLAALVGVLSYRFIEEPVRRWARRFTAAPQAAHPDVALQPTQA